MSMDEVIAGAGSPQMLRVDSARLDELIDLVGELLIAGAAAHQVARHHKIKEVMQATSGVNRLMERVRDTALNLRRVPIGGTFNRLQRVVRDAGQELGKDVRLLITGAETELDKAVVEKLFDPLMHLVRHALDHGIERADLRLAAGKPAQGSLHLHACQEGGQVLITVADDGGGMDAEAIFHTAIDNGFGAEMNVVKHSITSLRGTIELTSQRGVGTQVAIRLPLTLAIIDGFLMGVSQATYVVPLNTVVECIEMSGEQTRDQDWLDLRGELLPLIRMRDLYDIPGPAGRRQNIVVVDGAGKRVGLVVDQFMGELQTVIKPLGTVFQQVRGIAGFTIMGSGAVALLLDVPKLIEQVARHRTVETALPAHH